MTAVSGVLIRLVRVDTVQIQLIFLNLHYTYPFLVGQDSTGLVSKCFGNLSRNQFALVSFVEATVENKTSFAF